jgi:nucleoside-diphosphate-sugar epimerase
MSRMTAVLVSGGSGFIGLPVLRGLSDSGVEVHALSSRASPPEIKGVRWHALDLADSAGVQDLLGDLRPERLIHLAWYVEHGLFWDAPDNVVWVERSLDLLRAFARAGGRRALMLGTCAEYDWAAAGAPLHESRSPLAPSTLYGVSKDALRRIACAYAVREGFELAWGRLFFLYGEREAPGRLVASVIRSLLAGEPVETASGAQVRDFLHVHDAARAVIELLESNAVGPVNIASGEGVSLADMVDRVAGVFGRPELIKRGAIPDRPGEPPLLVGDVARLSDEVGFRRRIALDDGISATVAWWEQLAAAGAPHAR